MFSILILYFILIVLLEGGNSSGDLAAELSFAGSSPIASAANGLHSALPRPVRWLGWIMTLGILAPEPGFLLVVLLSPFWLFLLRRWMKGTISR